MRINSDKASALARAVLREHGGEWEKVKASGRVREDGVIVLKRPRLAPQESDRLRDRRSKA
jgi:hypothetical protein